MNRQMRNIGFYFFLLAFIFNVNQHLTGQATGDPHEDFLYGDYYVSQHLFQEALPFYLSVLKSDPENSNVNYHIGLCYSKLIGEQHLALKYLEKAVLNINEHYVGGKYKEPGAPVEAWLLLGDAYHRDNELLKASFAYHQYKDYVKVTDKKKFDEVMRKIMDIGISSEYQRTVDRDVRMINLGPTVNSRFSDYNPLLSQDQRLLIYTQFWETSDNIMISRYSKKRWSKPQSIDSEIGTEGNCYTSSLSYHGDELYLIYHKVQDYDVFVTSYRDGKWTKMIPVPGKVNSRYRESSVSISSDGNTLYFASDRPGGYGGFDIYKAEKIRGEWGNIKNIGNVVNTDKNEEAPYITTDGSKLFFSSNGHETVGNMDILYSDLDLEGNLAPPVNIGLPFNTTSDDLFFVYFPQTQTGYISRDLEDGFGKNDLYRVQTGDDIYLDVINTDSAVLASNFFIAPSRLIEMQVEPGDVVMTDDAGSGEVYTSMNTEGISENDNNDQAISPFETVTSSKTQTGRDSELPIEKQSTKLSETSIGSSPERSTETQTETRSQTKGKPETPIEKQLTGPTENLTTSNIETDSETPSETVIVEYRKNYAPDESQGTDADRSNIEQYHNNELNYSEYSDESALGENAYVSETFSDPDSLPTYTIQILALRKPMDPGKIKLKPVTVSPGNDGLNRYTWGEFIGYSKALNMLENIRESGFPDAFIRNIITIQNYGR